VLAALALIAALAAGPAGPDPLPASRLAVRTPAGWRTWWASDRAPAAWRGPDSVLQRALRLVPGAPGVHWGEAELGGSGEAWRTRLVVAVLDPARVSLGLALRLEARGGARRGAWRAGDADGDVLVALNAGQFSGAVPWGWLVREGRELRPPGAGPLAAALVVDTAGVVHWAAGDDVAAWRRGRGVRHAFQSYPVLLAAGVVPAPLRSAGAGIDVAHRDARLAIGLREDGMLVVALTRFDALGSAAGRLPLGLTTPEMAAVMGALGCRDALALDGGISGQLLLRDAAGERRLWSGMRRVPLGLEARARPASAATASAR
jgi:uncharacterized protein YigE (DUF2233 family)